MNRYLDEIEILMSQRIWGSGATLAPESVVSSFVFRLKGELVEWDWRDGPPPWRELETLREVKARALSRHIPASPFSWTTGSHLWVESGLEHDLIRELDRRQDVVWMVTQPCRLVLGGAGRHVPDVLEIRDDGVRLWDVRPVRRQDEAFSVKAARTLLACKELGIEYQVFDDAKPVRRGNLRWLSCYASAEGLWPLEVILTVLGDGRASTIEDLVDLFDADPRVLAGLWHLVWRGDVIVDLDRVITDQTQLSLGVQL